MNGRKSEMSELDDYRCVFPVLAPLCIVKRGEDDYRIVIDYSTSIDVYGRRKEQLYTEERFLDEEEAVQYLDDEIYEQDEEQNSCQRPLQKIGETYYYMHNVFAKIYLDNHDCCRCDEWAFLDFGEKGGKGDNILCERGFFDEKELLEYLRKESKRWGSSIVRKKEN